MDLFGRFDTHSTHTEEDLVNHLLEKYTEIDAYFVDHSMDSVLSVWPVVKDHVQSLQKRQFTLADALLFGFVVRAMSHSLLAEKVKPLSNLTGFARSIAKAAFRDQANESFQVRFFFLLCFLRCVNSQFDLFSPSYRFIDCWKIHSSSLMQPLRRWSIW